jgi:hypothetical protein
MRRAFQTLRRAGILLAAIVLTFLCGFYGSWSAGVNQESEMRAGAMDYVQRAAGILKGSRLAWIQGAAEDMSFPEYAGLRKQLQKLNSEARTIKWTYLMVQRENGIWFSADSVPELDPSYSPPGDIYTGAPPALREVFDTGRAKFAPCYTDAWGQFVSFYVPVQDSGGLTAPPVRVVLGADIEASRWKRDVMLSRLPWIGSTMLICLLLVLSYVGIQRIREAGTASTGAGTRA